MAAVKEIALAVVLGIVALLAFSTGAGLAAALR